MNPVSWNVVLAQMVSVLFAGIPFMVYLMASEELSPAFHDFYTDHLVIGRGDSHRAGFLWSCC